jgi:hypothetical protein
MVSKKIALAAALFAATSAVALAQDFDPNLANRYPGYAAPNAAPTVAPRFNSAPVRLNNQTGAYTGRSEFDVDRFDRASSPFAGGN